MIIAIIPCPYICDEVISIFVFSRSDGQKRDRSQGEGLFYFGVLIDIGNVTKLTYDCLLVAVNPNVRLKLPNVW